MSMSSQYNNIFFIYVFTYLSYIAITARKIVVFVQAFCIDFLKYFYIFLIRQYSSFKCYHKVCLRGMEFQTIFDRGSAEQNY